ncbi:hypothetical protein O3P69_006543 [Scylla paramamosain]|uniref:Uncharacterized protein n=1 Tax=Scylla paramamosain TaxID=85552 RepID=A0AAW0U6J2_SCYPA
MCGNIVGKVRHGGNHVVPLAPNETAAKRQVPRTTITYCQVVVMMVAGATLAFKTLKHTRVFHQMTGHLARISLVNCQLPALSGHYKKW